METCVNKAVVVVVRECKEKVSLLCFVSNGKMDYLKLYQLQYYTVSRM